MKIISLFSGIGGLDLGFISAGFEVIWANDCNQNAMINYCNNIIINHFDNRKFEHIPFSQMPDNFEGIIAGMPGNGWSISGNLSGIRNRKGQYIFDFVRLVNKKKPTFFLFEMLSGFSYKFNRQPYLFIIELLNDAGYTIYQKILNAKDYGVPQDRKRVFVVGIKNPIHKSFHFPSISKNRVSMFDSIYDLKDNAKKAIDGYRPNLDECEVINHEYIEGNFSPMFLSRNRVRGWDDVSFTIQGDRRLIPIHPGAPRMLKSGKDEYIFNPSQDEKYRRLSVRECARLQSFKDDFILKYETLNIGYQLIGNASPPLLAQNIAQQLLTYFE